MTGIWTTIITWNSELWWTRFVQNESENQFPPPTSSSWTATVPFSITGVPIMIIVWRSDSWVTSQKSSIVLDTRSRISPSFSSLCSIMWSCSVMWSLTELKKCWVHLRTHSFQIRRPLQGWSTPSASTPICFPFMLVTEMEERISKTVVPFSRFAAIIPLLTVFAHMMNITLRSSILPQTPLQWKKSLRGNSETD